MNVDWYAIGMTIQNGFRIFWKRRGLLKLPDRQWVVEAIGEKKWCSYLDDPVSNWSRTGIWVGTTNKVRSFGARLRRRRLMVRIHSFMK